ncbi:hypothetical protein DICVIV_10496 [Dictyocaulus viviparus]|uniref:Uncharacterized protein n=1 Tax=Dictyocaulus viviparus TaxID=29172 RepID=A0A0D8XFN8_DICVI|nr:hypothetical protein DICVIV_10496 [Dictyocaulus viviparus]
MNGTVTISSVYSGGITNRRCAETLNRDWCAVSYYSYGDVANFGCANDFTIPFGTEACGDGPGFINQQGCRMDNTPSGPCYFCCCRGGSCNNPVLFARSAASLFAPSPYLQGILWNNANSPFDVRVIMISGFVLYHVQ